MNARPAPEISAFGGAVTEAFPAERHDPRFPLVARGHGHVAALAGDGVPAAGDADEARGAQAGARAHHDPRRTLHGLPPTHLHDIPRAQDRQCVGLCGKVIEGRDPLQGEAASQVRDRERPVDVDHADLVAPDGRRYGKDGVIRPLAGRQHAEIGAEQPVEPGKFPVDEGLDVFDEPAGARERAARVRAPDVGDQPAHRRSIHGAPFRPEPAGRPEKKPPLGKGRWGWARMVCRLFIIFFVFLLRGSVRFFWS